MFRKFAAVLAAIMFTAVTLAPAADARDRRHDGYSRHYRDHDRYRRHHDDGDAVAAGVLGLVLGLALGSAASQPREPRYGGCYDRCAPPPRPRCDERCRGYQRGYYEDRRDDPRYDDRRGSAYEREYGDLEGGDENYYEPSREQCVRAERQWDRYANRYVMVDVPC